MQSELHIESRQDIYETYTIEPDIWVSLSSQGYENYSISNHGQVRNDTTGKLVHAHKNNRGLLYAALFQSGYRHNRSVARMVITEFVENSPHEAFNAVLHKDADKTNVSAGNLLWRPRWYTYKYYMTFSDFGEADWEREVPVYEGTHNIYFKNSILAGMYFGCRPIEVEMNIISKEYILFDKNLCFAWS